MAITNADILGWLNANPNADDDLIYKTMIEAGVTTEQYLSATGKPLPRGTSTSQVTNADILGWLNANPGASPALINETMKAAGVTSAQYQSATGLGLPTVTTSTPMPLPVSVADTQPPVPQVSTRPQAAPTPPSQGLLGGSAPSNPAVTNADILGWFNANPNANATLVNQTMQAAGVSPTQLASALSGNKEIAQTYLTKQILGQGTTSQWTGQGLGSAEKNAADMARLLSDAGITDINQLGKVPEYVPAEDTGQKKYNGQIVIPQSNPDNGTLTYGTYKGTGRLDNDGNEINTFVPVPKDAKLETVYGVRKDGGDSGTYYEPVDSSKLKTVDGKLLADSGQTIFGNKATGQAVKNNYEIGADAFGGTSAGSGTTGYRVDLSSGKPVFYTTAKSNSEFKQYAPLLAIASLGLAAPSLFAAGAGGAGSAAGLSALDAGLGVYGTGAVGTAGGIAGGLSALDAGMGVYGTSGTTGGLAGGLSALDAGMSVYPSTGNIGLSALDAGMGAYDVSNFGNAALDAGLGVYPSTGNIGLSALDAGLGAYGTGAGLLSNVGGAASTVLPASLTNAGVSTAINKIIGGGGTSNIPNLISGGLGTAGNLLQMQQSREAAQRAQAMIDAETAAAKASAAFKPFGVAGSRFGTAEYKYDPVTGQLTGAGISLTPEAKAQQDRFMALSQQGLTQAEQAQQQFAPLQTGAQRLFGLGNQYLAQSPQDVAQNYLNQQMALLQPGREQELATLQNRLQQQGRGGLAVAQGGAYGATTPELQALYNARAQQEAQLAANAQQFGQQQVSFGAGLLGQGSQAMGQYYGGQQAAYAPYTTAMGQVQSLEALGQQPFNMSNALAQQTSTAGARVGQLGLEGAKLSTALATSADATRNLGAQSLIAAGNPNAQFGSAIGSALGGLFNTPQSGFSYGQYGTGIDPSTGEYFGSLYF